jgi:hypothetical protein
MATTATPTKPKTATADVTRSDVKGERTIRLRGAVMIYPKIFKAEIARKRGEPPDPTKIPKYSALFELSEASERVLREAIAAACKEAGVKVPVGDKMCLKETPEIKGYSGPDLYPICISANSDGIDKTTKAPKPGPEVRRRDGVTPVTADIADTVHFVGGGIVTVELNIKAYSKWGTVAAFLNGLQAHEKMGPYGPLGVGGGPSFEPLQDDEDPVDPDELN